MTARRYVRTALAAGVAGAAALAALALAAGSSSASSATPPGFDPKAVEFRAVTVQEFGTDGKPAGPSVGDRFTLTQDLYYWEGTRRIGTDGVDCVVVRANRKTPEASALQCTGTLTVEGGQIAVQGVGRLLGERGEAVLAVLGGTGEFRDASGSLTVRRVDGKIHKLTLRLDNPWADGIDGVDGVTVEGGKPEAGIS